MEITASHPHLMCLSDKFEVGPLHDSIDRARLLAEAAVDALSHVDVIASCAAAAVLPLLSLNRDGLRRTHLRAGAEAMTTSDYC